MESYPSFRYVAVTSREERFDRGPGRRRPGLASTRPGQDLRGSVRRPLVRPPVGLGGQVPSLRMVPGQGHTSAGHARQHVRAHAGPLLGRGLGSGGRGGSHAIRHHRRGHGLFRLPAARFAGANQRLRDRSPRDPEKEAGAHPESGLAGSREPLLRAGGSDQEYSGRGPGRLGIRPNAADLPVFAGRRLLFDAGLPCQDAPIHCRWPRLRDANHRGLPARQGIVQPQVPWIQGRHARLRRGSR